MQFEVRKVNASLWHGTSKDEPALLIAEKTRDECMTAIVRTLDDLAAARNNKDKV